MPVGRGVQPGDAMTWRIVLSAFEQSVGMWSLGGEVSVYCLNDTVQNTERHMFSVCCLTSNGTLNGECTDKSMSVRTECVPESVQKAGR